MHELSVATRKTYGVHHEHNSHNIYSPRGRSTIPVFISYVVVFRRRLWTAGKARHQGILWAALSSRVGRRWLWAPGHAAARQLWPDEQPSWLAHLPAVSAWLMLADKCSLQIFDF